MIDLIIIALASIWLIYKTVRTKDLKFILIAAVIIALQLSKWPLFLPFQVSWGVIGIASAIILTLEKVLHKSLRSIYLYILILAGLGVVFLVEAFWNK